MFSACSRKNCRHDRCPTSRFCYYCRDKKKTSGSALRRSKSTSKKHELLSLAAFLNHPEVSKELYNNHRGDRKAVMDILRRGGGGGGGTAGAGTAGADVAPQLRQSESLRMSQSQSRSRTEYNRLREEKTLRDTFTNGELTNRETVVVRERTEGSETKEELTMKITQTKERMFKEIRNNIRGTMNRMLSNPDDPIFLAYRRACAPLSGGLAAYLELSADEAMQKLMGEADVMLAEQEALNAKISDFEELWKAKAAAAAKHPGWRGFYRYAAAMAPRLNITAGNTSPDWPKVHGHTDFSKSMAAVGNRFDIMRATALRLVPQAEERPEKGGVPHHIIKSIIGVQIVARLLKGGKGLRGAVKLMPMEFYDPIPTAHTHPNEGQGVMPEYYRHRRRLLPMMLYLQRLLPGTVEDAEGVHAGIFTDLVACRLRVRGFACIDTVYLPAPIIARLHRVLEHKMPEDQLQCYTDDVFGMRVLDPHTDRDKLQKRKGDFAFSEWALEFPKLPSVKEMLELQKRKKELQLLLSRKRPRDAATANTTITTEITQNERGLLYALRAFPELKAALDGRDMNLRSFMLRAAEMFQ